MGKGTIGPQASALDCRDFEGKAFKSTLTMPQTEVQSGKKWPREGEQGAGRT